MVRMALAVGAALALSGGIAYPAQSPRGPARGISEAARVISPSVVASWIAEYEPSGGTELVLLVLWRGTPGWFIGGGHNGSRTSGWEATKQMPQSGGVRRQGVQQEILFGGLTLNVRFDPDAGTARIQAEQIRLEDANVILVDDVDSPAGPRVIATRRIDPHPPGLPVRIEPAIASSPELAAFLRCDGTVADPSLQQMIMMICNQVQRR